MTTVQRFDFSVDLLRALIWQYNNAERLQSILQQKLEWYEINQEEFWTDWYNDVFNLLTANEFGLSVWGIILGIPLSVGLPGTGNRKVWGFGAFNQNFHKYNFGRDSSGVAGLTLKQKRLVLRLRYYQLVTDATVPNTNFILNQIFGMGKVLDGLNMTETYVFPTALDSEVAFVLQNYDLLPRPAGVGVNILVDPTKAFGFDPYYENFNHGTFRG